MRRVSRFAPPAAVMALIFYLSAQPGLNSGLSLDFVLRKGAHVTIYAVLWLSVLRALGWRRPLVATAITLAYAISDELHQSTVADRSGSARDVAIDAVGIVLAAVVWVLTRARLRRARSRRRRAQRASASAAS